MFLVDTSVWLEVILEQEKANEAKNFLQRADSTLLFITDFSIHSIEIFLLRAKKHEIFMDFLKDVFTRVGVQVARIEIAELEDLAQISRRLNLDFDDAYQYVAAEKYNLTIVSFDSDFDRTERGRKTPGEMLKG